MKKLILVGLLPLSAINFAPAKRACSENYGGHLASVHSQAENDFVSALLDTQGHGDITAWIGGFVLYHWGSRRIPVD